MQDHLECAFDDDGYAVSVNITKEMMRRMEKEWEAGQREDRDDVVTKFDLRRDKGQNGLCEANIERFQLDTRQDSELDGRPLDVSLTASTKAVGDVVLPEILLSDSVPRGADATVSVNSHRDIPPSAGTAPATRNKVEQSSTPLETRKKKKKTQRSLKHAKGPAQHGKKGDC